MMVRTVRLVFGCVNALALPFPTALQHVFFVSLASLRSKYLSTTLIDDYVTYRPLRPFEPVSRFQNEERLCFLLAAVDCLFVEPFRW